MNMWEYLWVYIYRSLFVIMYILWDFVIVELIFEVDFSNYDRVVVYDICKKLGLKFKSCGYVCDFCKNCS